MRHALRFLIIALGAALCGTVGASTLTLTVPNHMVVVHSEGAPSSTSVLRALWTDERLVAEVHLDVYQLPQMRSTTQHYDELRRVASRPHWLDAFTWTLVRRDTGTAVALGMPRVIQSVRRQRGPDAESSKDRDTVVAMTTLTARFDFGAIPAGDYRLTVQVAGLASSFDFSERSGAEPEVRDEYLRDRASKTRDYAEFRRIELERYERDPSRIDALLNLVDRSLQEGTAAEARADFDRAIAAYEARRQSFEPKVAAKVDAYVRDLRVARDAVPEYFQHKTEWSISRDPYTSVYSIRSRATSQVLRVLRAASDQ
jgi:hypothetical protein